VIYEINQVKRFLAEKFGLKVEGGSDKAHRLGWKSDSDLRVVGGTVPDGDYEIPLGEKLVKHKVSIKGGNIWIGDQVT